MIRYPKMKAGAGSRQRLEVFKGLDHRERIGTGMFSDMENLTSDHYPVLSPRGKRGLVRQLKYGCTGMIYVPEKGLFYVENTGEYSVLCLLGSDGTSRDIVYMNTNPKKLVLMGRYLVLIPNMRWVDIDSFGTGSMGETWTVDSGTVTVQMCAADGQLYEISTVSPEPPSAAGYHELWLCTAIGNEGLNQYEPISGEWVQIASTYLKITGLGEHYFQNGDGVEITGFRDLYRFDGNYVLQYAGHGDVIIPGIMEVATYTQDCAEKPITIQRKVPSLDFVVECGNRLWGCARKTNEIYACKLGDFRNWNCFQKLSTDSWVGSVGTPGEFTGAVVQNGYPVFYKETGKHKVWPSATGAHQLTFTPCDGVRAGCEDSIGIWEGTVFYRSRAGVCADDGSGTVDIGECLGCQECEYAVGAVLGQKYYLSMRKPDGSNDLFVYDLSKQLWHREDSAPIDYLVPGGGSLYGAMDTQLWDLTGKTGTPEETVSWMAVTGDLGLELPEQKYISRLTLRLSLEPGATFEIYAQYDREETWVKLGQVYGTDLRSFSLPVRPRRCDQLRLKLQGSGMCKLYSLTKTLEKGSELT